jgi:signal peptidase
MKLLGRIALGLGIVLFVACCSAVFLVGRPRFGWQALSVPTGSMRPTVSPGSLVVVHRISDSSLKVGDVITYTNPSTMRGTITHRIVRIITLKQGAKAYITKGDANKTADPLPAIGGLIQGKMVARVPYAGGVLMWGKTWAAIAVLIYLPALIMCIEEVMRLKRYYKKLMPYYLYPPRGSSAHQLPRGAYAGGLAAVVLVAGLAFAPSAFALFQSNTVALTPNTLSVATKVPNPTPSGNCSSSTNVDIHNTSTQSASSGSVASTGNTSGGSATSGSTTNNNSTDTNVTVRGC